MLKQKLEIVIIFTRSVLEFFFFLQQSMGGGGLEPSRTRVVVPACQCRYCKTFYVTDGNIMYLTDASRFLISCVIQHYAPVVGWRNRCIMLIMSLYPSWRQTLRLPPPGIEPRFPASQAGTLPKELSRHLIPMLQIRDFYPRSRILIFSHPGS